MKNTITIKANEIKSETIEYAMDEIASDDDLLMKAKQIADDNNWGIADTIEAIANHIIITDEDYVHRIDVVDYEKLKRDSEEVRVMLSERVEEITLYDMSLYKKEYWIIELIKEKYLTDTVIGTDGFEHYARLELNFEDYFALKLREFNSK